MSNPKPTVRTRASSTRRSSDWPSAWIGLPKSTSTVVARALIPAEATAMVAPKMAAIRSPGMGEGRRPTTKEGNT